MVGKSAALRQNRIKPLNGASWLFTPSLLRAQPPSAIPHVVQDLRRLRRSVRRSLSRDGVNLSAYRRYAPLAYLPNSTRARDSDVCTYSLASLGIRRFQWGRELGVQVCSPPRPEFRQGEFFSDVARTGFSLELSEL